MICPKCNKEGVRYIERRPKHTDDKNKWVRKNFKAVHKECGFEGDVK